MPPLAFPELYNYLTTARQERGQDILFEKGGMNITAVQINFQVLAHHKVMVFLLLRMVIMLQSGNISILHMHTASEENSKMSMETLES